VNSVREVLSFNIFLLSVCHSIKSTFGRSLFFSTRREIACSAVYIANSHPLRPAIPIKLPPPSPPKCTSNPSSPPCPSCPSSSFPSYPYPSPRQAPFPTMRSSTPHTSNPKSTRTSSPTTASTLHSSPSISLTIPPFTKRLTVRPHPVSAHSWPTKPPPGICAARSQSVLRCRRGWIGWRRAWMRVEGVSSRR
jgi:hypothetical protein